VAEANDLTHAADNKKRKRQAVQKAPRSADAKKAASDPVVHARIRRRRA